ncbi:MAG: hypothetical protein ACI4UB_01805 [Limosilactobacillus sp.]
MKKAKRINLTKITELHYDEETISFAPGWDNTILMTAYDRERTLVLTWDGRCLLLPHPLPAVLEQFASDNDIADYERQAVYDMIGVHKGRGYIAGNNRLVPTHGITNGGVVYYMARYLRDEHAVNGMVVASFRGRKRHIYRVTIDTSYETFMNLLQAANRAARLQLDILEWKMHNYGVKPVDRQQSVRFYGVCGEKRQKCRDLRRRGMLMLVRRVIRDYCTPAECEKIEQLIGHYIEK